MGASSNPGFRPEFGELELDFGFVQYFYRDDKTDYGEAYLHAGYDVTDQFSLGFSYWREVYFDYNTFYLGAAFSGLPWDLTLLGGIGSDFGSRNLAEDADYADIGLTKDLNDNLSITLSGHYSSIEENRLVATLSLYR